MKSINIILLITSLIYCPSVLAQNKEINELTNAYYGIKNALVADEAKTAVSHANDFIKHVECVSKSELTAAQEKVWKENKTQLLEAAGAISKKADINKQREQLNNLSNALFSVLKVFNMNENDVYYQYCPMKKAYWLSNEKEIKNPYYGQKMLTCGSVKDTLK